MLKKLIIGVLLLISTILWAQNDTSSPYSLYGIGVENKTSFGGFTALGNTGLAQKTTLQINNFNPANLANIPLGSFLYEVGVNGTYSNIKTNEISQTNNNFNFSHLVLAFPVTKNWGMSVGLMPYSKVGYDIDIENPIEGSTETFFTSINGSGGLNKLYWSNGFKLKSNLSIGVELVGLFGSINQEQWVLMGENTTYLNDKNVYFSFGVNAGIQYSLNNLLGTKTTLGTTINLPTVLRAAEASVGTKSNAIISSEFNQNADDFNLPLKIGVGISSQINKNLLVNVDYRKNYWADSNQFDNNSSYKDQSIYGIGFEFKPSANLTSYWNNVKYRVGANYDSGYLNISNQDINNYSFSLGIGLPTSKNRFSSIININYSYGREGTTSKGLIQENFHKLTLNLSLVGNWFQKLKIY
ncbi:MAG: hypothetical protein QM495_09080 [Lutibacter sp.]|uniref:OmpP1/FadL family transporter n=1 Tax=Lutibacter sp. TaxID=1925666 RepID=UPI00385D2680